MEFVFGEQQTDEHLSVLLDLERSRVEGASTSGGPKDFVPVC